MTSPDFGKIREWMSTAVMLALLVYGVGQWTGIIQIGAARAAAQEQQIADLRNIVASQSTAIAVLQIRVDQVKEQLDAISRTLGARVVP